eukprot:TRINITY_DN80021_c0_g1_i1.p1 TRINITY_DN80021_c0_g1~~TRINITY_DN80021_c0_g1_i1.p1  ORF type:complete len:732 (+),score=106.99 TRINITY_DN80021_c0_g1_i1:97-2292(+)
MLTPKGPTKGRRCACALIFVAIVGCYLTRDERSGFRSEALLSFGGFCRALGRPRRHVQRAAGPVGTAVLPTARLRGRPKRVTKRSQTSLRFSKPAKRWTMFHHMYCINLDRRPERWSHMESQFRTLDLPATRHPAVDGSTLDFSSLVDSGDVSREALERYHMPEAEKMFGIDLTPGALGCAMSHMDVWKDILQRVEFESVLDTRSMFLVVEDDCNFLPSFSEEMLCERVAEVPDDWELLFLGGADAAGIQQVLQISPGVRRAYHGSRETTAYIITAAGALAALDLCRPLVWQLDTQLTSAVEVITTTEPALSYTLRPRSYVLWPPLVTQDKAKFQTDVQKDEHQHYVEKKSDYNSTFSVEPRPWALSPGQLGPTSRAGRQDWQPSAAQASPALDQLPADSSYGLLGSWDGWTAVEHMQFSTSMNAFTAEIDVPAESLVEFQLVKEGDLDERVFPLQDGRVAVGPMAAAFGANWKTISPPAPSSWSRLHVVWRPTARSLEYAYCESAAVAQSRNYSLLGSWDSWTSSVALDRLGDGQQVHFVTDMTVTPGRELHFQVLCDENASSKLVPCPNGKAILGPTSGGHGSNWKVCVPDNCEIMHLCLHPTGVRSLCCSFSEASSEALARSYALVGSWSAWATLDELRREAPNSSVFVGSVDVRVGQEIKFKIICDEDYTRQMFPKDGIIVGPGQGGSSQDNWRMPGPPDDGTLHVRWDPTGRRSMACRFEAAEADD